VPTTSGVQITSWRGVGSTPLTDADAAAHVVAAAETRPGNTDANHYMPSDAEISTFRSARDNHGRGVVEANPFTAYVTGHFSGTTDEIIQWAAWKWGIPADWLRAEYVQESYWRQSAQGDRTYVGSANVAQYPAQSREKDSSGNYTGYVFQSLGITQVRWDPSGSTGAGTEPLRWKSTAFNIDYQAAAVRFYYDDPQGLRSGWGDTGYAKGLDWMSIGGWFSPYPWGNSGQLDYISKVQSQLNGRTWARAGF
jgi:hypothetical protein